MKKLASNGRQGDLAGRLGVAAAALVIGLAAHAARGEAPTPLADQLPGLHLLHGPWEGGTVYRESVLFVQGAGGKPSARLLFDVERLLAVHGANGRQRFEADRDYRLSPDGSTLVLTAGSRAPFRKEADFFLPKGSPNSIPHRAGHPETNILFGGCPFFHDQQVEVSYVPRDGKWAGYRPAFAGERLRGVIAKLKGKTPVTIGLSGDSISQGYDASGYGKVPPFMPPYPDLVAAQLETTYGTKVTLRNRAIAGWTTGLGIKDLDNLLKEKPDLVIIAYGMNDIGGRNPEAYKASIATLLRGIKAANPATDVILVATMIGNPDWAPTATDLFPAYRDALASLEGPGVVLADMTAIWQTLLKRKRFTDMVGNGVNHPDDYGHRLYAQAILALLVDPALAARGDGR